MFLHKNQYSRCYSQKLFFERCKFLGRWISVGIDPRTKMKETFPSFNSAAIFLFIFPKVPGLQTFQEFSVPRFFFLKIMPKLWIKFAQILNNVFKNFKRDSTIFCAKFSRNLIGILRKFWRPFHTILGKFLQIGIRNKIFGA